MKRLALLLASLLLPLAAVGQTFTVSATSVFNGSSTSIPLTSGQACFTPTGGGSPTCFTVTKGAFSGSLAPNLYNLAVTNTNTSQTILTLQNITVSANWVLDSYIVPASTSGVPDYSGVGAPYLNCIVGSLYNRLDPSNPLFATYTCGAVAQYTQWYLAPFNPSVQLDANNRTATQSFVYSQFNYLNLIPMFAGLHCTAGQVYIPFSNTCGAGGGGGTPAGITYALQYNNLGIFGGSAATISAIGAIFTPSTITVGGDPTIAPHVIAGPQSTVPSTWVFDWTTPGKTYSSISPIPQADQQAGTDFTDKIINCLAAAKANGTNICDARAMTGSWTMGSNLEFTSANANGITLLLGSNLSVTQGNYQVLIDPGVTGFSVLGASNWATSTGGCAAGGALFFYNSTASGYAWSVVGTESSTPLTRYIRLADFGICIIGAGVPTTTGGMYLGANVQNVSLERMRIVLPASSNQANPGNPSILLPDSTGYSLKLWGGATSAVHSALLTVTQPEFSGGAGVSIDGNGAVANWGQVSWVGGRIQATKMTWPTDSVGQVTFPNPGANCNAGGVLTVVQGGNTTAQITINFVDPITGEITGASVTTDGYGYSLATGLTTTGSTCTVQPTVSIISLGVKNRLASYGGSYPTGTQFCANITAGDSTMLNTDLENCDSGLRTIVSSNTTIIRPDGCCVRVGTTFDGSGAIGNNVISSPVHGGKDSAIEINGARANNVNNGIYLTSSPKAVLQYAPVGNFDAQFSFICGNQATSVRACNMYWGDASSGTTLNKWLMQMDTSYGFRLTDVGGNTGTRSLFQPGATGLTQFKGGAGDTFTLGFTPGNPFLMYHPIDTPMNILIQAGLTADQTKCFNFNTYAGVAQSLMCFSSTGMTYNAPSAMTSLTLTTPLAVASGGTGTTTPGLVAGTGCTSITGTWPNQTINCGSTGSPTVASINLTAQTAAISSTTIYTPAARGQYRVTFTMVLTTQGTAGTIQTIIGFNNGSVAGTTGCGGTTITTTATVGTQQFGTCNFVQASGTNITYNVTFTSVTGSPAYSLMATVEKLQ